MKEKLTAKDLFMIALGSLIIAVAVYYIMIPAGVVLGSVSGLGLVFSKFVPLTVSQLTMLLNIILLIVGYFAVGKDFGIKTVISSVLYPGFMALFEILTPDVPALTDDIVLNVVAYILILSLGQTILFTMNASSGGIDILAKILNKYLYFDLGVGMTIAGLVTSATAVLIYDRKTVVAGLLGTYFAGIILDYFLMGFGMKKKVCIISQNYEMVRSFIMDHLNRGVTFYEAFGGLNQEKRMEIITILEKNEYGQLLDYLKKEDPTAFITVYNVGEVIGFWNNNRRRK